MALQRSAPAAAGQRVRVWDLPTRLFHWLLALSMISAFVSAHLGGYAAQRLHFLSGYAVLALVGFRLAWGFAGPRYARFAQFVQAPAVTLGYVARLMRPEPGIQDPGYPGHNPLGALSVLALLAACGAQAATGLFSYDEVASAGPLAHFVSDALVERLSGLHDRGEVVLYVLIGLHLGAIGFYRWFKRDDLLVPMITGDKILPLAADAAPTEERGSWARAALLLGLSLALVCFVVNLA
jgi:cytochrome b